jgi:aminopeptidase N
MKLSSLIYPESIRNTTRHRKLLCLLAIFAWLFLGLPPASFSQYDHVPGMEKFPDIDITHYNLHAEFFPDMSIVRAKAVVEFQLNEARTDLVIFEIDRRAKILRANDGNGNPLRFEQHADSDYVVIHLAEPIEEKESARIKLDYNCSFPPLLNKSSNPEFIKESRQGIYFFLRKWYPVNDYFCDQAPADFTFILPKNYEILTSGHEVSSEIENNRKISQWKSFGSSNYYFVLAGPFIRYTFDDQVPKMVIDMDIKDSSALKVAKEKATNILKYYENLLCPYPYPVLYLATTHSKMDPVGLNGLTYIDYEQFSHKYKYSEWTWSHELAHHWFGGVIRAKMPEDYCFLMEGSAEYFSRLFILSTMGDERFKIDLKVQRMVALAGGEIAPLTEYYALERGGEFLYAKGSYIFHMLRHIVGDEKFFDLMRKLIQNFYMKPVGIQDLQELAEEAYGQSLKWFFDQWVYGTGIPEYELSYHIDPKEGGKYEVSGLIKQKAVEFRMPIEIVSRHKDKEYMHKELVERRENPFQFEVNFKPDTVLLDPEYKVLRWDDDLRVWLYTSSGRKLVHNKRYKEAEKLLDLALQINPNCSWAALERAATAELQDQIELALRLYLQALDGDLNFHLIPWPHEQLIQVLYLSVGYCYDLLGERQQAVAWYQKVIQTGRDPRFAFYYDKAQGYLKKPASKKK